MASGFLNKERCLQVFAIRASSIFEYHQGKGSPRVQGASIRSCHALAKSPTERCHDVFERQLEGIRKISFQEGEIGLSNSAVFVDAKIKPGVWSDRFFAVVRDTQGDTWIAEGKVNRFGGVTGKTIDATNFRDLNATANGSTLSVPALRHVSGSKVRFSFPKEDEQDQADALRMTQQAKQLANEGKHPWGTFPKAQYVGSVNN